MQDSLEKSPLNGGARKTRWHLFVNTAEAYPERSRRAVIQISRLPWIRALANSAGMTEKRVTDISEELCRV
jgi:hypothetical protein